ncbi:MAG: hypothetical protein U9R58_06100 [Chloroflexota bacterium]|nr:hypothetical protein [Chloroflexota bacterium]
MLDKEYEQIVDYLKGMIADGVQLIHGGHLLDWQDTNIPEIMQEIDRKKHEAENLTLEIADPLINRISGERVHVTYIFKKTVDLSSNSLNISFPKDKIWYHYRKVEPSD